MGKIKFNSSSEFKKSKIYFRIKENNVSLKDSTLNKLNTFLTLHPNITKDDLINKAICDYIKNYDKLAIYSKEDSK